MIAKEPRILVGESVGINNANLEESIQRVDKSKMYRDNSTIIICPTRGLFPTRVVQSWMKLMKPMNQLVAGPIFAESMKVDVAYETLFEYIIGNTYLSKFKYVLTIEEDNLPPSDGLLKLYESMDEYDVVGGLYWGKGENGFPMIFGDPETPGDFKPVTPVANSIQRANGLGMGFNLFKLDMFRTIPQPWFKTVEEKTEEGLDVSNTQDIYFYKKAAQYNFKVACDTRVLVGHYSCSEDKIW
jgi:hypothetical protein